eukprot:Nitzschia sp. Nitz4//scaffold6_size259037//223246//223896//NITZ4_001119-RA/size259037-processed-gene-0.95-mRNA-1//-1//CDS//3329557028//1662//frame0
MSSKPKILCLHGHSQSGATFTAKIGGARRKLSRLFDLDFLDAPILVPPPTSSGETAANTPTMLAWWTRDSQGRDVAMEEAFNYVRDYAKDKHYDALIGFSQGGLLATALALSGDVPGVGAVVTAGAPFVEETFTLAKARAADKGLDYKVGEAIPKLHFAGETDAVISVVRVEQLHEAGGNGRLELHEKGHLFPTKADQVNLMIRFLEEHALGAKDR